MFFKLLFLISCVSLALQSFNIYSFNAKQLIPKIFSRQETVALPAKEYPINNLVALELENINGNVTIKSWDQKDKIVVDAVKKGSKEEVENTTIRVSTKDGKAYITTVTSDPKQVADVEYTIMIPQNVNIKSLKTNKGDVKVKNIQGTVQVNVNEGNIDLSDTTKTIVAHTNNGCIKLKQKTLHEPNALFLVTSKGNINLYLPRTVHTNIQARTLHGTISSQQEITLQPITMKLTKDNWNRIRSDIKGTIGNGGAPITIDVTKGNIYFHIY